MRILFLVGATSRIRNFHDALLLLATRGHEVRLAGRLRKGAFDISTAIEHERISGRVNPTERSDEWREAVDLLRGARDFVRYFDPAYAQATRLVRRAYETAPTAFALYCNSHPWIRRHWRLVAGGLAFCERLIPSDRGFEAFLREENPDVIAVTPLVTFESYQTDYVKAAHRLGIPIVFLPFSWDNLTNKGLIRVQPDRVLVWNEIQRQEAIELHGVPQRKIVATGAARFDSFFRRTPSVSREEFCTQHGLDPARPLLLYLGSSQLTGPNEMELVRQWVEGLRGADDEALRNCGIVLRPHPALRVSWASARFSDLGHISLSLTAERDGDQSLFDALYYSHAAVGLNTSAMLEAAIVGTPVHTLLVPGFDSGQLGTIHFRYLVEAFGGIATVAYDLAEHQRQLASVLRQPRGSAGRNDTFVEGFLRPRGIEFEASPILADEIERAAEIHKKPKHADPLWQKPLRWGLLTWVRGRIAEKTLAEDTSVLARSMSLQVVRTALEELRGSSTPVFVGPWLDSVENELLYWIPFLTRTAALYGLGPERLVVLSSGEKSWYGSLAQRYLDPRALLSPAELEYWQRRTVPQSQQDTKQAMLSPVDQEILARAARTFDFPDYDVLPAALLFRTLLRLRKGRMEHHLPDLLHFSLCVPPRHEVRVQLPKRFVAFSLSFTPALPRTDRNVHALMAAINEAAENGDVVVVDNPEPRSIELRSERIQYLSTGASGISMRTLQTVALARARRFVGAYGEMAVLSAACGTGAKAFHSERLTNRDLDCLRLAAESGGWGRVVFKKIRRRAESVPHVVHS